MSQLTKQLKDKSLKIRTQAMKTFSDLGRVLHDALQPFFTEILPELEHNLQDSSHSYDLVLDTLTLLRRIFRSETKEKAIKDFQKGSEKIMKIIDFSLNHEYSKVIAEGLRVAGSFVNLLIGANNVIDGQFKAVG